MRQRLTGLVAGRRTKWMAVGLWLVIAALLVPLGAKLSEAGKNDAITWLPRSAEATRAYERAQAAFPGAEKLVAVVVYERAAGLTPADQAKINNDRALFTPLAEAGRLSPPIPSADGQAVIFSFPLTGTEDEQAAAIKQIKTTIRAGTPDGLRTALTGSAGAVDDVIDAFSGLDTTLLLVTGAVVALLLLITYRSPVLWLVPLISVGIASQVAAGVVYLLARHAGITVNGQSQGIMTVLVFGAGTDYALLLIARYREELRRHADRHQAMAVALRRSYPAILASAATVAMGLFCLLAAQLNNIRGLGPVGAAGIVAAFAVMTTLLPALLVVCGRWLFWPFVPRFTPDAAAHDIAEEHGLWARVAGAIGRRPRLVWLTTTLALAALALGVFGLHPGLRPSDGFTKEVGSVTGQRLVAAHYPAGQSAPADVLTDAASAGPVLAAVRAVPGVAAVPPPVTSADGRWARISAVLADPPDSPAGKDTVDRLRAAVHGVSGADALVGGDTAVTLDTERAAAHDNRVVIPLILLVVLIVLVLLLRALVAPVLLIASVVASFAAAFGAAGLIFRALGYPNFDLGLPLLAFLFLVALGVDYTIFLMTRAREEAAALGHRDGLLHALTVTGGVITSAGIVLAATFATLAVLPLVALLHLGLIVAVGVLLDTLVVRTLLVPALALDAGPRIWWPGRR